MGIHPQRLIPMPSVLHAAVLFEYPSLNGGEFSWLATLDALQAASIQITAIAPPTGPLADRLSSRNVPIVPWEVHEGSVRVAQDVLRERLSAILQRLRPDLVHANSLSMSRLLGPVTARLRIASLGHIRDIVRLSRKAMDDVNQMDRLLAVSHATREWHVANGIAPDRVVVEYNGVDLERFRPRRSDPTTSVWRKKLGLPESVRLIGCMGQLGLRKGTDVALQAAERLASRYPDVHWMIAGERHSQKEEAIAFESRLRQIADRGPMKHHAHFIGRVADTAQWMSELTMLIHAARQEPLGRVLIEASAAGLPIVATDAGGTREILGPDNLVPIDAPDELAKSIDALLSDPAGCADAGAKARKCAEIHFNAQNAGSRLCSHYKTVVFQNL